jgi:hypothetical protein
MKPLDLIALLFIPITIIMVAAGIVFLGSLPAKIARRRNHPWPDAVNMASWIGLTTGVFWPVAFIWAFLPVPRSDGKPDAEPEAAAAASDETAGLRERIDALEAELAQLKGQDKAAEGAA